MKVFFKKIYTDSVLPTRAHAEDAGMDMYVYGDVTLKPYSTETLNTGVSFELEKGYVGLIWDKSSVGAKGVKTLGGVVDSSYRGEIKVVVHNLNDTEVSFVSGQKIAQMLIQKVELAEIEEVKELSNTERGTGSFGSTGK